MAEKAAVMWNDAYSVGVKLIDDQHKGLIALTNELAKGCQKGGDEAEIYFMKAIQGAVKYVKIHFTTEEIIMERLHYPEFLIHKKEHEDFVAEVLRDVKEFEQGKKIVPMAFVKYLQDWVLTHIAKSDKKYGVFFDDLRKKGQLDESRFVV
jgi:hemerythrin